MSQPEPTIDLVLPTWSEDWPQILIECARARRQQLAAELGPDALVIIPPYPAVVRNRDVHYPYRFDSDFWYLTAFAEPESGLILRGGDGHSTLYCRESDPALEQWEGRRAGLEGALRWQVHASKPVHQFASDLATSLRGYKKIYWPVGRGQPQALLDAWQALINGRSSEEAPEALYNLSSLLAAKRLIKAPHELAIMQCAARISDHGHLQAMRGAPNANYEYELEAALLGEFRRLGAHSISYPPIVAAGVNACILHYQENQAGIADDDLVLIDAGCEVYGYAADITRTFPRSGRFSAPQKSIYQLVLAAHQAAIAAAKPGVAMHAPHDAAVAVLSAGLIDLGLLSGSVDDAIAQGSYKKWFMHGTSHWLGLDVHDVGGRLNADKQPLHLAEGMVLTIEPGLYFMPEATADERFAGIGVRIEDDIVIETQGARTLSHAPRTVADIEYWMRHQ